MQKTIANQPLALSKSAEMSTGRKVAILVLDESNPADAVLTAVWT